MSYSNIKSVSNVTKQYANTASFPTDNLIPGIKAIDSETNIIYYWNGTAWYKIDTQEAPVRTFSLEFIGTLPVIEGDGFEISLNTTNVDDSTEVSYSYYYRTPTTSTTPVTGSFEIQSGTNVTGPVIIVPDDNTIEQNTEFVLELDNGKDSIVVPIQLKTIVQDFWIKDEQLWINGENGSWTVPDGVTSISVAALGGGNSARQGSLEDIAGGGGALSWTNNIPVVPGQILSYNASRAGITFNEQQNLNESSFLRNDADLNVYVFAEKGHSDASALDAGMPKGSGGRASVGIGDVTYSGGRGTFGTLDGVRGGSAAGWAGTNTTSNIDYTTGRGGYGTGPYGSDANGAPDYNITPPNNSNNGAIFGGGGGAKNPNRHQGDPTAGWGSGAGGFVRVIYPGDVRQFPNTEANKQGLRSFLLTAPKTVLSGETFDVTIVGVQVPAGFSGTVTVTGLPDGDLTNNYITPSFTADRTFTSIFQVPEIDTTYPLTITFEDDFNGIVYNTVEITAKPITWSVDVDNITYDNEDLSVGTVDTRPTGITFNNDGTKMFMSGDTNFRIHEFSLSTPFDIGTAGTTGASINVGQQDGDPQDVAFNNDGTRMFVLGYSTQKRVFQYNLDNPYSFSGFSYTQTNSVDVSPQEALPLALAFNNDGTRMYIAGSVQRRVYQYNLSTPFTVSTATYSGNNYFFDTAGTPSSIQFNEDGSKMYMLSRNNDAIFQYSLSTPFDISTVSYDNKQRTLIGNRQYEGMCFSSDGTKLFAVDLSFRTIYQYSTTPAFTPDYTITVTNSGNNYILSGSDRNGSFTNSSQPTLAFNSGDNVRFVINAGTAAAHPFFIKTTQSTGTGNQVSGVDGQGTIQLDWTTATDGAGSYGYQCSIHLNMWNTITIT